MRNHSGRHKSSVAWKTSILSEFLQLRERDKGNLIYVGFQFQALAFIHHRKAAYLYGSPFLWNFRDELNLKKTRKLSRLVKQDLSGDVQVPDSTMGCGYVGNTRASEGIPRL